MLSRKKKKKNSHNKKKENRPPHFSTGDQIKKDDYDQTY